MSQSIFPILIVDKFIPSLWSLSSTTLTREYADLHYLKFPLAQGSETIPANLTVSGITSLGNTFINTSEIHLGTGSGVGQGTKSIAIGENAGIGQVANCIQINSTGANITQTDASSCVIAPIRNTTPITSTSGNYSLPLLYNTTSKELFNNNLPTINLTAINNTADNSYYNSFIIVTTAGAGTINIPTPIVSFPAYIIFYNATSSTKTLTVPSGLITRIFSGTSSSTTTFVVPIGGVVRLDTNGSVWYLTSSGGLASILNSIQFGYTTAPNFTTASLGYNATVLSSTDNQIITFANPQTTIAGCVTASLPTGVYIFNAKILLTATSAVGHQFTFDIYANSGGLAVFSYNYIATSTASGTFSDITFSYIHQVGSGQPFSLRGTSNTATTSPDPPSSLTLGLAGTTTLKVVRIA